MTSLPLDDLLRTDLTAIGPTLITGITAIVPLPVTMKTMPSLQAAIDWGIQEASVLGGEVDGELLEHGAAAIERVRPAM